MKVQDDQRWAEHVSDIRADGEPGQRFHTFYTFWFDAADRMCDEGYLGEFGVDGPALAMRKALDLAEREFGFLDTDTIGAMLCVASMHWIHGETMTEGLTFIEARVMQQALARKIADLQNQAASTPAAPPAAAGP